MLNRVWVVALACVLLPQAGCQKPQPLALPRSSGAGSVAVVDLDAVAQSLGWVRELEKDMGILDKNLKDQYETIRVSYQQQIDEELRNLGYHPGVQATPQQMKLMEPMTSTAERTLAQMQTAAPQVFSRYRDERLQEMRKALMPLVRRMAREREFTVVMGNSEKVIFRHGSVDLSRSIIDEVTGHPVKLAQVPFPTLDAPATLPKVAAMRPILEAPRPAPDNRPVFEPRPISPDSRPARAPQPIAPDTRPVLERRPIWLDSRPTLGPRPISPDSRPAPDPQP